MIDKRIGKRVKQCMERLGISHEELAEKTGLTANYISTVERGMSFPAESSAQPSAKCASALAETTKQVSPRVQTIYSLSNAP